MMAKNILAFYLGLLVVSASAKTYDSTGPVRLWAPNNSGAGATEIVQVPGYGSFTEGGVVKGYDIVESNAGNCSASQYIGVCSAKKGAPGYRYYQWEVCPVETVKVQIHVVGTWHTCGD